MGKSRHKKEPCSGSFGDSPLIGDGDQEYQRQEQQVHYRPLSATYDIEQSMAEVALTEEITSSLAGRGFSKDRFEIVKDEATQQYVVRNVAGIKSAERQGERLTLENLRAIAEIPMSYELTADHQFYSDFHRLLNEQFSALGNDATSMPHPQLGKHLERRAFPVKVHTKVLDGQIFQLHEVAGYNIYFLVTPDGKSMPPFQGDGKSNFLSGTAKHPIVRRLSGDLVYLSDETNGDSFGDFTFEYNYTGQAIVVGTDCYWVGKAREADAEKQYALFRKGENLTARINTAPGSIQDVKQIAGIIIVLTRNDDGTVVLHRFNESGWEVSSWFNSAQVDWQGSEKLTFAAIDSQGMIAFHDGVTRRETKVISEEILEVIRVGEKIYAKIYSPGAGFQIINEQGKLQPVYVTTKLQNIDGKLVYYELSVTKGRYAGVLHVGDAEYPIEGWAFPLGMVGGKVLCADTDSVEHNGDNDRIELDSNQSITQLFLHGDDRQFLTLPPGTQILSNRDGILLLRYPIHGQKAWRILEYRYGGQTSDAKVELELSEDERRKLQLLNLLESDDPQAVKEFLGQMDELYPPKERLKNQVEQSPRFTAEMNEMIREAPRMFLDMFPAKRDRISDKKLDTIIDRLFPTLRQLTEQSRFGTGRAAPREGSLLDASTNLREVRDGDPRQSDGKTLLKLREGVEGMFATSTLGSYNSDSRTWNRLVVPVSDRTVGPVREVTAEIPSTFGLTQVILPKHVQGRIIPERIHGVTSRGEEIALQAEFNALGEAKVTVPKGVEKIIYSQSIPELPVDPDDLSEGQYAHFRDDIVRRFGHELIAPVAELPEELKIFVRSIRQLQPYDRVVAIERFVREHGHYDFANGEVQQQKRDLTIAESIDFIQLRMEELARRDPGLVAMHFAGVCADFANLTVALLRASGIPSGLMTGLRANQQETTLTQQHAHGIAYALWPDADGKVKLVEIDATPGPDASHTFKEAELLIGLIQPSLEEKRRQRKEGFASVDTEAKEALAELEQLIATHDIASIKRLQNGALEQVLNTVLRHVTTSHLSVVNEALSAARYAGFDARRLLGVEDGGVAELGMHLRYALNQSRTQRVAAEPFQGQQLIQLIEDFIRRYSRGPDAVSSDQALTILERVIDVAAPMLDELESRSAMAVITYLRARRMTQ